MAESLDVGITPPSKQEEELAIKLVLPRCTAGIYKRSEIFNAIKYVDPLTEILGLGMLQMYFEW